MKKSNPKILVVGGAGYIGSHMTRLLFDEGYQPVVFDNLSTGNRRFIDKKVPFIQGDLCVLKDIEAVLKRYRFEAVMNFAGSIVVSESVTQPLKYYENNVFGAINLLKAMQRYRVNRIVFSSTAAIYGQARKFPVTEEESLKPCNPYAMSKWMIEEIIADASRASDLSYVILRYFNVAGSHPQADLGINLKNATHLIPNVMQVASGRKPYLEVYGNRYSTADGTCIRDYIYVLDLCRAHLLALKALNRGVKQEIINLGSGRGFSVSEVIEATKKVTGKQIKTVIRRQREGDVPKMVAGFQKASKVLGWKPQTPLEQILETAWRWEKECLKTS